MQMNAFIAYWITQMVVLWCVFFMLCISWAQVETLLRPLHDLCAQLGTHEIQAATTFTTWNHVALDVVQRHSRDYYSLLSLGSASVLHVTTWKSTITQWHYCNSAHAHVLLPTYDKNTHKNTHDLCP